MIGEFANDEVPRVARFEGKVAILSGTDDGPDTHGFLITRAGAIDLAVALLGAVGDLDGGSDYGFDVDGMHGRIIKVPGADPEALLTLHLRKASFTLRLTAAQLAELAASLRIGVEMADRPSGPPRKDR